MSRSWLRSSQSARFTCGSAERFEPMENLIVGVIAVGLFVYLLVAMLRPEKF